jgi:polar amino acid transport system substrate-binding protein
MTKRLSWFHLIILSLLAVTLVACGEGILGGSHTPTPLLSPPTPTAIPLPPDASTAARIRARGYLLVGVRYDDEPFGIVDEQGDLVGFDVDLAREFASRWLGDAEAVKFVQVTNASANERIKEGQVDLIIGALPHTQDAALDMDFSAAYYYDGLSLLVRTDRPPTDTLAIHGPGDLAGVPVGVVEEGDTEEPLFRATGGAVPRVVYYPDYFSAVAGVENGVIEAAVGPARTLARLAGDYTDLGLTPRFTRDPYAIGVPKNDGSFRDLVNVTLMDIIGDGSYATLFQRWFPGETPPDGSTEPSSRAFVPSSGRGAQAEGLAEVLETWARTSRLSFDGLSDTLSPAPSTIQAIEARGALLVGVVDDQLPFGDFDANGVARGFEADLARTLSGRWLGDVSAVQFVRHSEESGIAALVAGQIDLLAARLPHTLPRDDEIDFSLTIYQGGIGLLVSAESGVSALADLNRGTVAVPPGGVAADAVQRAAAQAGIIISLQTVNDVNVALAGVADGTYLAYGGWRSELLNLAYANAGFVVLDERLTRRPMALGLRQGDSAFRDLVDFTLQEMAVEGRFAALYDDWFGTDPPFPVEIWPGTPYRALELNPLPLAVPTATP